MEEVLAERANDVKRLKDSIHYTKLDIHESKGKLKALEEKLVVAQEKLQEEVNHYKKYIQSKATDL